VILGIIILLTALFAISIYLSLLIYGAVFFVSGLAAVLLMGALGYPDKLFFVIGGVIGAAVFALAVHKLE
jgi:hypothetical protein